MNMDLFCARHNDKIWFNKRKRIQRDAEPTIYYRVELLMVFLPLRVLNRELSIATGSERSHYPISPTPLPHFYDSIQKQQLKHHYNNFTSGTSLFLSKLPALAFSNVFCQYNKFPFEHTTILFIQFCAWSFEPY